MDCKENNFGEKGLKGSKQGNASPIKKEEYVEPMKSSSPATLSCSSSSYLSSSQDLEDDATSSSNSSHSSGPLYELDDLMAQLPIKRGLSKYYNGKSQTFTSLTDVESVEDLAKKDEGYNNSCYSRRMKSCKSFGGSSNSKHHRKLGPKATINKEANCKRLVSHSMAAKLWIL